MSKLKVNNIEPLSGSELTLLSDVVIDGVLTTREVRSELSQSIVLFQSGSTKLGDTADDSHQVTGSLFVSGNATLHNDLTVEGYTMFENDQFLTGSLFTSGARVEFNVGWPEAGAERHIIKTEPFTWSSSNSQRNYQYAAFNLDHFEGGGNDLHNSMRLYMYDSHDTPTYGSEIVVSPLDVKMQIIPSQSNGAGRTAKIEVRDDEFGRTVAAVNANHVAIGTNFLDTDLIQLGNPSASVEMRADSYIQYSDLLVSGNIDSTYPSNKIRFFYPGEGDLPDPSVYHGMFAHVHGTGKAYYSHQGGWTALATSESVDTRFAALEAFSSSLDATYATDAEVAAAVSALNAATSSYALVADVNTYTSSADARLDALEAATSSYSTGSHTSIDALNTFTGSIQGEVDSLTASTSSYALGADLATLDGLFTTFTGSIQGEVDSLTAATASYETSASVAGNYISIESLKALVAGAPTYNDFTASIAAL